MTNILQILFTLVSNSPIYSNLLLRSINEGDILVNNLKKLLKPTASRFYSNPSIIDLNLIIKILKTIGEYDSQDIRGVSNSMSPERYNNK